MNNIVGVLCVTLCLFFPSFAFSKAVEEKAVQKIAKLWIKQNAVFQRAAQNFTKGEKFTVESITPIAFDATGSVLTYHIDLQPKGFMIISGDDLLNPVVCYSATTEMDLSDQPDNSFRAILMRDFDGFRNTLKNFRKGIKDTKRDQQIEKNRQKWKDLVANADMVFAVEGQVDDTTASYLEKEFVAASIVGPFLNTTWNQNRHYNYYCPLDPAASDYYYGRMPVGCVAVAAGQIVNHYAWPPFGNGSHSYTWDGNILSADFSDTYDWGAMLPDYDPWNEEPTAAVEAVAELLYELGVSVEMQYSHGGSSSSVSDMSNSLNSYYYYELGQRIVRASDITAFEEALDQEMRSGHPTLVSIPGHAVVADGIDTTGEDSYYHINYGWGGTNDSWYLVTSVTGDPLEDAMIGTIPSFIPLLNPIVAGQSAGTYSLSWSFPQSRITELDSFTLLEGQYQSGTLFDQADNFEQWQDSGSWQLDNPGYGGTGSAFFVSSTALGDHSLSLTDAVKAGNMTTLTFYYKAILLDQTLTVEVSVDSAESWDTIFTVTDQYLSNWQYAELDLSAYSGSQVLIRFREVFPGGSYYPSGGVWLDDISLSGGAILSWQPVANDIPPATTSYIVSGRSQGTYYYSMQACTVNTCGLRSPAVERAVGSQGFLPPILFLLLGEN